MARASNDAMVLAFALTFFNQEIQTEVEVYQWTETVLEWTKRATIAGPCCSVDLSSDGSIISVGTAEVGGSSVRTYKWNSTNYEQL
jgi:hypothetical protein